MGVGRRTKGGVMDDCDGQILWLFLKCMDVSIAEAKNRFSQLVRAAESGEAVIITRNGRPVAQLVPAPSSRRKVRLGGMREQIRLLPGWDDPIDLNRFLAGGL
jgi:prevent-host-death family protein